MPSPFPGMDPYLEDPVFWPDVHHELMSVLRAMLNEQIRPRYVVRIEERVYVSDELDPGRHVLVPDVRIIEASEENRVARVTEEVAVAEPIVRTTLIDEEIHEAFLQIVDPKTRDVVTVIEVLSPSNKVRGSYGRQSYTHKRHELMHSQVHFVELDFLRGGERMPVEGGLPPCDYLVHVSRVSERPQGRLWPIRMEQSLPLIPIPLADGDPDATVELKHLIERVYENGGYDLLLDYNESPPPPMLSEVQREWLNALVAADSDRG